METDLRCVNLRPQVYEYSSGFGDSAVQGNTNSGIYMEIQDVDLDDHVNRGRGSGTDSVVGGEMVSGNFPEISDSQRVDAYEEVLDMVTDYPSQQHGMVEEYPCAMRSNITRPDNSVQEKVSSSHDSSVAGEAPKVNKPINMMEGADATDLIDKDIYDSGDAMVAIENEIRENKVINIVKAADEIVLMDNDIYESNSGMVDAQNEAREDKLMNSMKVADETDLMSNHICESGGGMVAIENEVLEDKPISIVKAADETD